jgi:hypothetical protein
MCNLRQLSLFHNYAPSLSLSKCPIWLREGLYLYDHKLTLIFHSNITFPYLYHRPSTDGTHSRISLDILREDIRDTVDIAKSKQPARSLPDEELALHLWRQELDNYNRSIGTKHL